MQQLSPPMQSSCSSGMDAAFALRSQQDASIGRPTSLSCAQKGAPCINKAAAQTINTAINLSMPQHPHRSCPDAK
jgi:hypothetical protein